MFAAKKPTAGALEQLEWALERYLEEVISPDNRQRIQDNSDAAYKKIIDECHAFQIKLMEAQVDRVITPGQARLIAINLLLTSFESDNLRRTDSGFIVTSEEWERLQRESGEMPGATTA
jgi:hypothetical protein